MPRLQIAARGLLPLLLGLLALSGCLGNTVTITVYSTGTSAATAASASYPHPRVDPEYIYQQLFRLVTQHQSRESGYAVSPFGAPSGHDGFADDWTAEMLKDLQGFSPVVVRNTFTTTGWRDRPPTRPSFNVEVSIPGLTHPEQMVIIGCHYDGEASSTQSAYDDASGCAIELGVARAMATYWSEHHLYPARTLRFVIFDAEEQILVGSYVYLNTLVDGDWPNIIAMINEEQNGIAYPLRFLGKLRNALLPFMAYTSPQSPNDVYPKLTLTDAQRANFRRFQQLVRQSVPETFAWFQAQGITSLDYRDDAKHPVTRPVFAPTDQRNVYVGDDTYGASDQIPFTEVGIPTVTYVGDHSYYTGPFTAWSYPYDQPEDTIQLMNVYASGHTAKSPALTLALALPALLSAWMLAAPDVLGSASADGLPVAALSDIGPLQTGRSLRLSAAGSYNPADPTGSLTYAWDFGDGTKAVGASAQHVYSQAGDYLLELAVTANGHTRHITKQLHVGDAPLVHLYPFKHRMSGIPQHNDNVIIPTPEP